MKTRHSHHTSRRMEAAFTLVELLVTILIIIVLAAISLFSLGKFRNAGEQVVATRNLSQLQLANAGYAADNNGQYASVYAFDDKGSKYVAWTGNSKFVSYLKGDSAVFLASGKIDSSLPLNMLDPIAVKARKESYAKLEGSFAYNTTGTVGGWNTPNASPAFRISQVTDPARSAAFLTATDWQTNYAARFLWAGDAAVEGLSRDRKIAYRHKGKAMVAYYDGHVGAVSVADLKLIDQQGGASNIFWNAAAK